MIPIPILTPGPGWYFFSILPGWAGFLLNSPGLVFLSQSDTGLGQQGILHSGVGIYPQSGLGLALFLSQPGFGISGAAGIISLSIRAGNRREPAAQHIIYTRESQRHHLVGLGAGPPRSRGLAMP